MLFSDEFDYQTRDDFLKGVLESEEVGCGLSCQQRGAV